VVALVRREATSAEAEQLDTDRVYHLTRVRLLSGRPVMIERTAYPERVGALVAGMDIDHESITQRLQELVARLWTSRETTTRLRQAEAAYAERRDSLQRALGGHGISATGRSGLNVWVAVAEEAAVVAALAARGWAVRAGERYRLQSPPAIRVTAARLAPADAQRFAFDLAAILRPSRRLATARP
jgi:DNA-binding transcriptional MocR family regulator